MLTFCFWLIGNIYCRCLLTTSWIFRTNLIQTTQMSLRLGCGIISPTFDRVSKMLLLFCKCEYIQGTCSIPSALSMSFSTFILQGLLQPISSSSRFLFQFLIYSVKNAMNAKQHLLVHQTGLFVSFIYLFNPSMFHNKSKLNNRNLKIFQKSVFLTLCDPAAMLVTMGFDQAAGTMIAGWTSWLFSNVLYVGDGKKELRTKLVYPLLCPSFSKALYCQKNQYNFYRFRFGIVHRKLVNGYGYGLSWTQELLTLK